MRAVLRWPCFLFDLRQYSSKTNHCIVDILETNSMRNNMRVDIFGIDNKGVDILVINNLRVDIFGNLDKMGVDILGIETMEVDILGLGNMGVEILGLGNMGVDIYGIDNMGVDIFGIDNMGVDILGIDNMGVDNLGIENMGVDILGMDNMGADILGKWGGLAQCLASQTMDQGVPSLRPGRVAVHCGLEHLPPA